jgi:hypothetical protein
MSWLSLTFKILKAYDIVGGDGDNFLFLRFFITFFCGRLIFSEAHYRTPCALYIRTSHRFTIDVTKFEIVSFCTTTMWTQTKFESV